MNLKDLIQMANEADEQGRYLEADNIDAHLKIGAAIPSYIQPYIKRLPKKPFMKEYLKNNYLNKNFQETLKRKYGSYWVLPTGKIVEVWLNHGPSIDYTLEHLSPSQRSRMLDAVDIHGYYEIMGAVYGMIRIYMCGDTLYVTSHSKPTLQQIAVIRQFQDHHEVPINIDQQYDVQEAGFYRNIDAWIKDVENHVHHFVEPVKKTPKKSVQNTLPGTSEFQEKLKQIDDFNMANPDPKKERELELRKLYPGDPITQKLYTQSAGTRRTIFRKASGTPVPPLPGETPIPDGTVRRFHVTGAQNTDDIRDHGLLQSKAKGIEGPKGIYSWTDAKSAENYGGNGANGIIVEFWDYPELYDAHRLARFGDIPPQQIVAIHEPWHQSYRFLLKQKPEEAYENAQFVLSDDSFIDHPLGRAAKEYLKTNPLSPNDSKTQSAEVKYKRKKLAAVPYLYDMFKKHPFDKNLFMKIFTDKYKPLEDFDKLRRNDATSLWIMPNGTIIDLGYDYHNESIDNIWRDMLKMVPDSERETIHELKALPLYPTMGTAFGMMRVFVTSNWVLVNADSKPTAAQIQAVETILDHSVSKNLNVEQRSDLGRHSYNNIEEWKEDYVYRYNAMEEKYKQQLFTKTDWSKEEQPEKSYKEVLQDIEWEEGNLPDWKKQKEEELKQLYPNDPVTQQLYTRSANKRK